DRRPGDNVLDIAETLLQDLDNDAANIGVDHGRAWRSSAGVSTGPAAGTYRDEAGGTSAEDHLESGGALAHRSGRPVDLGRGARNAARCDRYRRGRGPVRNLAEGLAIPSHASAGSPRSAPVVAS